MQSFTEAVEKFLKSADWLTDVDAPAVMGLQASGHDLDKKFTSAALSQFRQLHRDLAKGKPVTAAQVDPLNTLLDSQRP